MKLLERKAAEQLFLSVKGHSHLKGVRKIIRSEEESLGKSQCFSGNYGRHKDQKLRGQGRVRNVPSFPSKFTTRERDTGKKCSSWTLGKKGEVDDFRSV